MPSVVLMPVHIRYNPEVIDPARLPDITRSIGDEVAITLRPEVDHLHRDWLQIMCDPAQPGDNTSFDFIVEIDTGLSPDRASEIKGMIEHLEFFFKEGLFREEPVRFCFWLKFTPMLCVYTAAT